MVDRYLWISLQRLTLWLSVFCVKRGFVGLPIYCLKYFSGPACFVEDVAGQGGGVHVSCDLSLEFFVVCYTVGDEVGLDHVWKDWFVSWSLCLVRGGVDFFCPLVTVYVEKSRLGEG